MTFLDRILEVVRQEIASARSERPPSQLASRIADAPPVRNFLQPLATGNFRLIAEIKMRSPSVGPMRPENVADASTVYQEHPIVAAISFLTNKTHFGLSIEDLAKTRNSVSKPILRKDFIIEEYQIREARAFGADAILLMANVLDPSRLQGFYDLARELGMQALFEIHEEKEIELLPADAKLVGINSRKFKSNSGFLNPGQSSARDWTLDFSAFHFVKKLPPDTLHIAESGLTPSTIPQIAQSFHAGLVGTSILRDPRGTRACLDEFQKALTPASLPISSSG